jgi:hypothetical protein
MSGLLFNGAKFRSLTVTPSGKSLCKWDVRMLHEA